MVFGVVNRTSNGGIAKKMPDAFFEHASEPWKQFLYVARWSDVQIVGLEAPQLCVFSARWLHVQNVGLEALQLCVFSLLQFSLSIQPKTHGLCD